MIGAATGGKRSVFAVAGSIGFKNHCHTLPFQTFARFILRNSHQIVV